MDAVTPHITDDDLDCCVCCQKQICDTSNKTDEFMCEDCAVECDSQFFFEFGAKIWRRYAAVWQSLSNEEKLRLVEEQLRLVEIVLSNEEKLRLVEQVGHYEKFRLVEIVLNM